MYWLLLINWLISILPLKFYEIKQFCIFVFYFNRNQLFMYIEDIAAMALSTPISPLGSSTQPFSDQVRL